MNETLNEGPILFSKGIFNEMIQHGMECIPYEACGLLSGKENHVITIWPLKNERKSQKQFFVSEKIVEQTLKEIEKSGEFLQAIYHTHPTTSPIPSSVDLANHADENIAMVIISYKQKTPLVKWYVLMHKQYAERIITLI
ncbi:Mov34/MPN/PAD-1 family protein [Gracilibacillus oryzae]|nr:M67 family metallopeptidase [Gracilibacillus oryzae]